MNDSAIRDLKFPLATNNDFKLSKESVFAWPAEMLSESVLMKRLHFLSLVNSRACR